MTELEDPLSTIISLLPLRAAVRTSILSRRWRYTWRSRDCLTFDADNLFGIGSPWYRKFWCSLTREEKNSQTSDFVRIVNAVLQNLPGSRIKTFEVVFYLLRDYHQQHLDQWVDKAITARVEKLTLSLGSNVSILDEEFYRFPHHLFRCRNTDLKCVHLVCCILRLPADFEGFYSLTDLTLENIVLNDEEFVILLSNCSLLERLKVMHCHLLNNLKITGTSPRLKYLRVCSRRPSLLEEICIHAINLTTFEYSGPLVRFSFVEVPRLLHAFIAIELVPVDVASVFLSLPQYLPQLETLCYHFGAAHRFFPEDLPTFTDLKQLVMILPARLDEDLLWIASILKACPFLEKLYVDFHTPFRAVGDSKEVGKPSKLQFHTPYKAVGDSKEARKPSKFPHSQLKEVRLSGFGGLKRQMEFAVYVLNNAVKLELMAIEPYFKRYVGEGRWEISAVGDCSEHPWYRLSAPTIRKQLCQEALPQTKVVILSTDWKKSAKAHEHLPKIIHEPK